MDKQSKLSNDIKKLQYQLSYSQHISTDPVLQFLDRELSDQLSALLQKMGLPARQTHTLENINLINTQIHLQELYYVQPLLLAYQHKIHLLTTQLGQLRQDSHALIRFGQEIVADNTFLRKELQTKNQVILKSEQIGLNVNFLKLDNQNLIEKNSILQEKNDFLLEKIHELDQEGQKNKQNYSKPSILLQESEKQLQAEKDKARVKVVEMLQIQKKLEIVTNQLHNQKSMLAQQEKRNYQLQNQIVKLKNEVKIGKQQLEAYQIAHQGTSSNLNMEIQSLKSQLSASQRRQNQLFTKTMSLQTQVQDKTVKSHNLSLQTTQLQTNNNNLLQMLETYQTKSTSQTKRIKQLEQQLKEHSEVTMSQRKECELLEWKLSEKAKQIERKEGEWRKERARIGQMWQDRFEALKKVMGEDREVIYESIQRKDKGGIQIKTK